MLFETPADAIDLLKQDHREVESLFSELERSDDKIELAERICTELTIHAQIEEEIFYPAARRVLSGEESDLVSEAAVEHESLKRLIADINGSKQDDQFKARLTVLKEYVQHHVREEENELMPAMRRADADLDSLGEELSERKQALKSQLERSAAQSRRSSGGRVRVPTIGRRAPAARRKTATRKRAAPRRASARQSGTAKAASKRTTGKRAQAQRGKTAARRRS